MSERLPRHYIAKPGERLQLISTKDEAAAQFVPDVSVLRENPPPAEVQSAKPEPGGGVAVAIEPVTIPSLDTIEVREGYLEILRLPDYELVTSIELLSPSNKFGEGIGEYRTKRRLLVSRGIHVVEIDLLRRGRRTELARPLPVADYYAFVFRGDRRPEVNVYPWRLRDPLPTIPVPLNKPDPDVPLNLAAVVSTAYDRGRYARMLRYNVPPPGPLSPEDGRWAVEVARAAAEPR